MFPFPSVLGGELRDSIKSPFKQQTSVDGIQLCAEAKDSTEAGELAQLEMATMTGTGTSASQQSFSDSESYDENESDSSQSRNKPQRVARWSKFVRNLYEMTMDPKNEQAVGFSGDGLCLELRDGKHLSNDVLHKYFKHRNVSSFIRQLNNYGFKTVPIVMNSALSHCFAHDCFQKGRTDLLVGVVRRSGANDPAKVSAESTEKLKRKTLEYEQKMSQLLRMTEDLRQQNQDLQEENKRLKAAWLQSQEALRYKMFEQQQQQQSQQHHQLLQHQSSQVMSHQQASSQHMPQQLHTSTVQLGGVPIIQRRLTTAPIHPSQTQQPEPFLQYPNVPDPGDNFFFLNNQGFFGDE